MTDLAAKLAKDVFDRIERDGLCQPHVIEDELRCRLPAGTSAGPQVTSAPVTHEAKRLCSLLVSDAVLRTQVPSSVLYRVMCLLDALNKEGHIV